MTIEGLKQKIAECDMKIKQGLATVEQIKAGVYQERGKMKAYIEMLQEAEAATSVPEEPPAPPTDLEPGAV